MSQAIHQKPITILQYIYQLKNSYNIWRQRDDNCNRTLSHFYTLCRILCYLNRDKGHSQSRVNHTVNKASNVRGNHQHFYYSICFSYPNDPEELTTQGDKCNAFLARIEKLDLDMHNSQQAQLQKSLKEGLVLTKKSNQQMSTEIQRALEVKGELQASEA